MELIHVHRDELEKSEAKYDVIIGDLADPIEGGPCNDLYTHSFYQQVLKPRLNHHGIFITQVSSINLFNDLFPKKKKKSP